MMNSCSRLTFLCIVLSHGAFEMEGFFCMAWNFTSSEYGQRLAAWCCTGTIQCGVSRSGFGGVSGAPRSRFTKRHLEGVSAGNCDVEFWFKAICYIHAPRWTPYHSEIMPVQDSKSFAPVAKVPRGRNAKNKPKKTSSAQLNGIDGHRPPLQGDAMEKADYGLRTSRAGFHAYRLCGGRWSAAE
jgi:hypothetical protein